MSLLPAVRELYSRQPEVFYLEPYELQSLLWILCYAADDEGPPSPYEVADALEVLDVERGVAA